MSPSYIKEHVSNVVTEIVAHLSDEEKALCEKAVELAAGTWDQLRDSDYREMSIVLAKHEEEETLVAVE